MDKVNHRAELEERASFQWGLFTTAQAQRQGVRRNQISRMVDQGRIEPVTYGVYRFTVGEESDFTFIKAAWMSVNPSEQVQYRLASYPYDAVIAGRTAASMLGAGDFYSAPYTFIVNKRRQTTRDDIHYLISSVDEQDITFVSSLPVTSFERTVYDLVRLHEDPSLIDGFIRDASEHRNHYFDAKRLSELLRPLAARNGYAKNDGETFASDLLIRNSAKIYAEKSKRSLSAVNELLLSLNHHLDLLELSPMALDSSVASEAARSAEDPSVYKEIIAKIASTMMPIFELQSQLGDISAIVESIRETASIFFGINPSSDPKDDFSALTPE